MYVSRRSMLRGSVAAGVIGVAGGGLALSATGADAALPTVYMDRAVVQAQVEPVRGQTKLPGNAGVEQIQKALNAKGYRTAVDGWYGTGTRSKYSAWQRHLGYSGLGANGVPGPTSLTKLGANRFHVAHMINTGGRTTWSGEPINQRTSTMLSAAQKRSGIGIHLAQGSYQGCSSYSACTHAGGGAVDVSVSSLGTTARWRLVKALRSVGFAAWLRTPAQGFSYHIHAVAIGDTDAHQQAADQVADYYIGRNGLASHSADNTPSAYRVPFTWWEAVQRGSQ